jgi:hypothetical protein
MKLKFPGVPVYMNGQNYYIPSLSLIDFKELSEILAARAGSNTPAVEIHDRDTPYILKAINRNYPEVTEDELRGWLDVFTFNEAAKAMLAASGVTPVVEGE